MVYFRLDQGLARRVGVDDVLQEAYLDAAQRLSSFLDEPPEASVYVWLRLITMQTLINVHRRHYGAQARDIGRERAIRGPASPQATSMSIANLLMARVSSPSQIVQRVEAGEQVHKAIDEMEPIDQEILALRHFEELSNTEVAEILGIEQKAASIRYVRAIKRLQQLLEKFPDFAKIW